MKLRLGVPRWLPLLSAAFCTICVVGLLPSLASADDWLPVTPQEMAYKDVPGDPGASAVVLYRESVDDDTRAVESNYVRIKILTAEGKKYGDIELPYWKGRIGIDNVDAHTIEPDGRIVRFNGQVYDKVVIKNKYLKVQEKAFSLPEVQVGSILEYRYKKHWDPLYIFSTQWMLQHELFTVKAHFSFRPDEQALREGWRVYWMNEGIPKEKQPKEQRDGTMTMDAQDIPAFKTEEFMPPEEMLQQRIDFFYSENEIKAPDKFWRQQGKKWNDGGEGFIGKRKAIAAAASEAIGNATEPGAKLRALYARAQSVRNLSWEHEKTLKEEEREKLKEDNNAEDVLKRGYGYHTDINLFFAALARSAGFDTAIVRVPDRSETFFNQNLTVSRQMTGEVVRVSVNGNDMFFDPGTIYCPFGLLPWERTAVKGLLLDKDGGSFIELPLPKPDDAIIKRTADLKLSLDGSLEGEVKVAFTGREALQRRLEGYDEDATARKKDIEDEIKAGLPGNAQLTFEPITSWDKTEEPLEVTAKVSMPAFAAHAGRRAMMALGIFEYNDRALFDSEKRTWPVYFHYPSREIDDVTITLPPEIQVESLPAARHVGGGVALYEISAEQQPSTIHLKRDLQMGGIIFPTDVYPALRSFYAQVHAGDQDKMVLRAMPLGAHVQTDSNGNIEIVR